MGKIFRTVLVTGATGGLGGAVVRALVDGAGVEKIWAASRRATSDETDLPDDPRVERVGLDVTDPSSIEGLAARVNSADKGLDLLVQTAGLLHDEEIGVAPEKRIEQVELAALSRSFLVNAAGPILLARALLPALRRADSATVVNVSARVGSIDDNQLGGWYAYRAAKAAQNQLTRTLSIELGRRAKSAVVIAYHPGTIDTALSAPFSAHVPAHKLFSPTRAAGHLVDVASAVERRDSGSFFGWDGERIAW
jgi:NAD(P)-dependent dehydrogenase (short-subunit alcohol dehydrogenase family)